MHVCIFIKLHITTQSGPVIRVILCHSHWSSQGGINDTCYENLWSNATKGTHSFYLYKSYLSPEHLVLPPLLPCCSLGYPGWQLLNQPFLFYIFFAFPPWLPRFPRGVYSYFAVSCAFSPPFRPPQSYSRSRCRRPRSHLRYSPCFCPRSRPRSHQVFVYGSPPPSPSPFPPRPHSRPRPRPALLHSLPPPFPLPLRPRPLDCPRPRYRLHSHPRLQSRPRPRSLLPAPRIRLPPRYDALVPTPGLSN